MPDDADDPLVVLQEEVSSLRDLFQRRLLEDKAKQRLFDELYSQVEFARKGLITQALEPLVRDELLLLDRLEQYIGDDREFVETVWMELTEILSRRGIQEAPHLVSFDPRVHEAVERVEVSEEQVGRVLAVRRRGYVLGDRVLRPAQVVVGGSTPVTEPSSNVPASTTVSPASGPSSASEPWSEGQATPSPLAPDGEGPPEVA